MNALKKFGLGILWALLTPILLIGIALVAVFGVFNFFVQFIIMVINFFRGKKLFPPFPEDEKAYRILKRAIDEQNGEKPVEQPVQAQPQQVYVQQNYYTQPGPIPGIPPQNPYGNPYQGLPPQQPPYVQQPQQPPYIQQPQQQYQPLPNPVEQQPPVNMPPLAEIPQQERPAEKVNIFVDDGEDEQ